MVASKFLLLISRRITARPGSTRLCWGLGLLFLAVQCCAVWNFVLGWNFRNIFVLRRGILMFFLDCLLNLDLLGWNFDSFILCEIRRWLFLKELVWKRVSFWTLHSITIFAVFQSYFVSFGLDFLLSFSIPVWTRFLKILGSGFRDNSL